MVRFRNDCNFLFHYYSDKMKGVVAMGKWIEINEIKKKQLDIFEREKNGKLLI